VQEALQDALAIPGLDAILQQAVAARRAELVVERQALRARLEAQEHAAAATWLHGIDDLAPGMADTLTVTVLFPASS
ncbi:MAG TPA: hypothetical protein PKH77_06440, partial [Anaerolineae bacterium]|nr:hypothetical protein [Anaerolineae bacterium]